MFNFVQFTELIFVIFVKLLWKVFFVIFEIQ